MTWRFDGWREFPLDVVLIAAACAAVSFFLYRHFELNLADEGFLWYGTIRTALGDVPLRDFQSYDPARYYWGALWFKILGNDGINSLRFSAHVLQFLGSCFGLLVVRRTTRKWWALAAAGLLLWLWMGSYEWVIMAAAVYFGVLLIERPSALRHFTAGVFVGIAAFFGRNNGLYCALAFVALILFIWFRLDRRQLPMRICMWSLGIFVGYLPMLTMIVLVPGFFHVMIEAIKFNLLVATRLPLSAPWPWRPDYSRMSWGVAAFEFGVGLLYLVIPIFYVAAGIHLLFTKHLQRKTALIASVFVGLVYLHYTFSRASFVYLNYTIEPALIGLMTLPAVFGQRYRKVLTVGVWSFLLVASWTTVWVVRCISVKAAVKAVAAPRYHGSFDLAYRNYNFVRTNVRGEDLWLATDKAKLVQDVTAMVEQRVSPDEAILIAPYWTTFYPILRKKSPAWEIYFLFPQSRSKQEEMINDLERKTVNWALICNEALDGRDELRFSNTHSYLWQYLMENFEPVGVDVLPNECQFLHRKERIAVK